ncbi:MAG: cell filamentation protein Fic [Bacteroidetes bacterium]|nr:MAG: cell filamentation protein Fic [Bacteroidota bacterium]
MNIEKQILDFLKSNPESSSNQILENIEEKKSIATIKRILSKLVSKNLISTTGKGKSTRYQLSPFYKLFENIDIQRYYEKEIDERTIVENFNFALLTDILPNVNLLTVNELEKLSVLQDKFTQNISELSEYQYNKELERLAIDLSWKSSQIEGNTYSLLETEKLLKEKETASGKTKEEAIMLLNHKDAIDFIVENPDYLYPLTVSKIEDIHSILTKELDVDRNMRKRRVGISGTNYRPLDNEFQIKEALSLMCDLINKKENVFDQAILALILISYIQPFVDGNKRTARIVSNAILINHKYCPISFRTVDSVDYKKAMLLFYEQNNVTIFKKIFIEQFEFAVKTYF